MDISQILSHLNQALQPRLPLLDAAHTTAQRLFNGFYEGLPDLSVDLFGHTLVLYNYSDQPTTLSPLIQTAIELYRTNLPWLNAILLKTRRAADPSDRRGSLLFGISLDDRICEHGVWYALDLQMNQDASFYLDTRNLRQWLLENTADQTVLNTFAYTGSLGIAALAGGATSVLQTDLNPRFLDLAKRSTALNPSFTGQHSLRTGDFFRVAGALRQQNVRFDTVILDAPFYSQTSGGQVDLLNQSARLINKIRPLVAQNGRLIVINNALFLSGADYLASLQALCGDGYMEIEALLPIPQDFIGYAQGFEPHLPADPAPFNHSTKIAILRLTRRL
jgi:23S rRNA (cytosine1962-C5)-methyltransferase